MQTLRVRRYMIQSLRTGSWLTPERLRTYPLILLVGLTLALAFLVATKEGLMDRFDRPLGTDFSQVWTAGREVLAGNPEMAYDNPAHAQQQREIFGSKTQFYGWHYPPFFLGLAAGRALLPYLLALLVWQASTLALYLVAVRQILLPPDRALPGRSFGPAGLDSLARSHGGKSALEVRGPVKWLIPALAFPAVFVNIGHGHNGFLTAALLAGGLLFLDKKPWLAGVLLGLLAYKPQFALVLPVALLAGGYWRSLLSAGGTVALMVAASLAAWGTAIWHGFFASLAFTREVVLEQGSTGFEKIQTVFAAVRLVGGTIELAYAAQTLVTLAVMAATGWLWWSKADFRLKAAALMVATMLTTPYALDYDMMVLGPALAFLVAHGLERGFAPYEKSLLAGVWLVPLLARATGGAAHLPLGLVMMLALFGLVIVRAQAQRRNLAGERQLAIA